jgi:hypothetical protein
MKFITVLFPVCFLCTGVAIASDYLTDSDSILVQEEVLTKPANTNQLNQFLIPWKNNGKYRQISFKYCPFKTNNECRIWKLKPTVNETVSAQNQKIDDNKINEFIDVAKQGGDLNAFDLVSEPFINNYKLLVKSATACCTDGLIYKLQSDGMDKDFIFKFLSNDANSNNATSRCMMMTDQDLEKIYEKQSDIDNIASIRTSCVCKNKVWFENMLSPFVKLYDRAPEFMNKKFYYNYTDGLNRKITVSVNADVQNILNQLKNCP